MRIRSTMFLCRMAVIWYAEKIEKNGLINNSMKHGRGGVMVWGCMSAAGVGNLVIIEEIMNKTVYLNILKNNLNQSAEKFKIRNDYYFQQDNDPKHTDLDAKSRYESYRALVGSFRKTIGLSYFK